jgi:hypothetical protein
MKSTTADVSNSPENYPADISVVREQQCSDEHPPTVKHGLLHRPGRVLLDSAALHPANKIAEKERSSQIMNTAVCPLDRGGSDGIFALASLAITS